MTLLLTGQVVRDVTLPDGAEELNPPVSLPPIPGFRRHVVRLLNEHGARESFRDLLKSGLRVTIAVDDFTTPAPPPARDARPDMASAVLEVLFQAGLTPSDVTVLVLTGLNRRWRDVELAELLGPTVAGSATLLAHDADDAAAHVEVNGIHFHRALVECDLLVHLNVVTSPVNLGLVPLVRGGTSAASLRRLSRPELFSGTETPWKAGSAWHRAQSAAGAHLSQRVRVLQLSVVLDNELWPGPLKGLLAEGLRPSRPLRIWNATPRRVRNQALGLARSNVRPIAVYFGRPSEVEPKARTFYLRQHEVFSPRGPAGVLMFGIPDTGALSVSPRPNPLSAAHLGVGLFANWSSGDPLLKENGVLVFGHPLTPEFDGEDMQPARALYDDVLPTHREPEDMAGAVEAAFTSRQDLLDAYRAHAAPHPLRAVINWYQCLPIRRRARHIIAATADNAAAERFGFLPARDLDDALDSAMSKSSGSDVRLLHVPPPFVVRVNSGH